MTRISLMVIKFKRATTLLELMISMSILSLVFIGVMVVLNKGMAYLRTNQNALDAQRAALLTVNSLTREVERTNMAFVGFTNGGLAFADPYGGITDPSRNITPTMQSNDAGQLLWQRYVCYFLDSSTKKLYRRECPYYKYAPAQALTFPPAAGSMVCQLPTEDPLNVTWFSTQNSFPARLIADDICAFNITSQLVTIPPPGAGTIPVVNITLEAGDPAKNDFNQFWFQLQTQVAPRN